MRLLVAENDPALATFLHSSFDAEHYTVDLTRNGEEAKQMVAERSYDLAILDMNLAVSGGMQVLQSLRAKQRQLPILVLSGRNRPEDRVEVLDMGADDLVLKPFPFSELSARVRALLRRGGRASNTVLCMEDLELNRVEHSVKRASRGVELTPKEFALLEYLMRNAGQDVTRAQIIEHVWNLSFDTMTNVVDVYINYSSAQVDQRRAGQLAMAIQVAFQQMGVFDSSNSKPGLVNTEPMPFADVQMIENVKRLQAMGRLVNSPQGYLVESPDRPNLGDVQTKLGTLLAPQIKQQTVSVAPSKEGVVVSLREAGFFDSGSTELRPQAIPTLSAIVKVIGPERMRIRIEGYTRNHQALHHEICDRAGAPFRVGLWRILSGRLERHSGRAFDESARGSGDIELERGTRNTFAERRGCSARCAPSRAAIGFLGGRHDSFASNSSAATVRCHNSPDCFLGSRGAILCECVRSAHRHRRGA